MCVNGAVCVVAVAFLIVAWRTTVYSIGRLSWISVYSTTNGSSILLYVLFQALQEGISPQELCRKYKAIHEEVYEWFGVDFDYFGQTSTPQQTE